MTQPESTAINVFVISMIVMPVILFLLYYKFRPQIDKFIEQRKIKRRFSSEQGTARWATTQHLQKLTGKDGVLVGYDTTAIIPKEVRLSMQASCEHLAIIGPTGCGKTTKFFIPNILTDWIGICFFQISIAQS